VTDLSKCSRCGSSIRWVETNHGKRMPLDPPRKEFEPPFPAPPNVYVNDDTGIARVLSAVELEVWPEHLKSKLYLAHFVTCAAAAAAARFHRRPA
jgi:hypothetical protein